MRVVPAYKLWVRLRVWGWRFPKPLAGAVRELLRLSTAVVEAIPAEVSPNYPDRLRRARMGLAVALAPVIMLFVSFSAAL